VTSFASHPEIADANVPQQGAPNVTLPVGPSDGPPDQKEKA